MSIQATCDSCGKTYSLNEKYLGKRLPCKECGELFEVLEDDEFEAPPTRPRKAAGAKASPSAPKRSATSKKKAGKKRKKASGPNWLMIGLAGGGGLLAIGGLIWVLISLVGTSHESLAKDTIAAMEDLGAILAGVSDVPSAQAAVPKIQKLGDRIADLYRREQELKKSEPLSADDEKALKEKYEPQVKAAQEKMSEAMKRLSGNREVLQILQEPMMEIAKKMSDATREVRQQQLDEMKQKLEERRAAAKAKAEQNATSTP